MKNIAFFVPLHVVLAFVVVGVVGGLGGVGGVDGLVVSGSRVDPGPGAVFCSYQSVTHTS